VSVCLLDTSVFCNIVPVPGRDQDKEAALSQMRAYVDSGTSLLLPIAAILETGNLIGRLSDGSSRRSAASDFARVVTQAIRGEAPFTPTPLVEPEVLLEWIDEFPDSAMRRLGLADLSIIKEFERQCELNPHRRVFIWSLDQHLAGYVRPAPSGPSRR
jgi:hypothetical protein